MLKKISIGLLSLVALYFVGALTLVFWPGEEHSEVALQIKRAVDEGELPAEVIYQGIEAAGGPSRTQVNSYDELKFKVRDGTTLFSRLYRASEDNDSDTVIVLVHGVGGDSAPFNTTAGLLREATGATLITLDLRGHGQSEGRPWDVDYIGQYEDDVADVLDQVIEEWPGARIILSGHSMGGGVSLRFSQAGGEPPVDGYLLFAPHLGGNSPTVRTEMPEGAENPDAPYMTFRLPRFIGLIMLNTVGVTAFNGLPVMFLNDPPALPAYSYRGLASGIPQDYVSALESVDKPLLVLVGSEDEPFLGGEFEAIISAHTDGKTVLYQGINHNGIHTHAEAVAEAAAWIESLEK